MKKLILILIPLLMEMSCNLGNEDSTPAYVGTWSMTKNNTSEEFLLTLTEATFEIYKKSTVVTSVELIKPNKGTISVDDNNITMNLTHIFNGSEYVEKVKTHSGTWSVDEDKLTLSLTDSSTGETETLILIKK